MNLLIDVGNTAVKYVIEQQGALNEIKRVDHAELTHTYFSEYLIAPNKARIKKIVIASVAGANITENISIWAAQANIDVEQIFTPAEKFSIKVGYENHRQLGVDRWLTLVGVTIKYPQQACLIVDLGTATTVDLLSSTGQHLGGWILPGLKTMQSSLLANTAQIQINSAKPPSLLFANNTSDNVINGCLAATVGALELAITQAKQLIPQLDHIILTGGNACLLGDYFTEHTTVMDDLVFQGLQFYL